MGPSEALIAFVPAAGLLAITPGLDTALVLRTAASENGWRALCAGAGICLGCLLWGIVAAFGLGALLDASRTAYTALRWAGAAYLIYLGGRMALNARSRMDEAAGESAAPGASTAVPAGGWPSIWLSRGLLTNILNPKVGVFYVTFLPQFVPAGVDVRSFTLLLASIHVLESFLWFVLLIAMTRPLAAALCRPGVVRTLDRITGGILIAFGLKLFFSARHA
ncbi:LysE family translocator [Oceanidesulfovibrio marinus]|uniref:LysE family translocator n=1 Tax=Oceanidesulfovibrio marinus TaxID=370038 RepID=A0ABX6NGI6_9BACT|nr:LysE family translocator [Oceanidesulfovibrio marinus]QJT09749.1 LysE family translocator [Oceanidesulfovibrio marinus]